MTPWTPRKHDDFFLKKIFAALLQITKMSALPQITNNIIFYFFKKKLFAVVQQINQFATPQVF
jgi:hypothetical protein